MFAIQVQASGPESKLTKFEMRNCLYGVSYSCSERHFLTPLTYTGEQILTTPAS